MDSPAMWWPERGSDIDDDGNLIDRVYDVVADEYAYPVPVRFTVGDLELVREAEVGSQESCHREIG